MKKVKSFLITFLILACMACLTVGLVACGKSDDPSPEVEQGETGGDTGGDTSGGTADDGQSGEHTHSLIYVEATAATCTKEGNTEYWYCEGCETCFSDSDAKTEVALADTVIAKAAHTPSKTEAVEAKCETAGNIDFWTCGVCEKIFSDEGCTTEITEAQTVVAATGHTIIEIAERNATCAEEGNIACWQCETCEKYFSDAAATAELSAESVIISKTAHTPTKTEAKAAECSTMTDGNIEYWTCDVCQKIFSNEACTVEITLEDTVVKAAHIIGTQVAEVASTCTTNGTAAHFECSVCQRCFSDPMGNTEMTEEQLVLQLADHDLVLTAAVAATCYSTGMQEYYTCQYDDCGKNFSDAEATQEITDLQSLVISMTEHTPEHRYVCVDGAEGLESMSGHYECYRCTVCGVEFTDQSCNTAVPTDESELNTWLETALNDHESEVTRYVDDTYHLMTCDVCGYTLSEGHTGDASSCSCCKHTDDDVEELYVPGGDHEHYHVYWCHGCDQVFASMEYLAYSEEYEIANWLLWIDEGSITISDAEGEAYIDEHIEEFEIWEAILIYVSTEQCTIYDLDGNIAGYYKSSGSSSHSIKCALCGMYGYCAMHTWTNGSGSTCSVCGYGVAEDPVESFSADSLNIYVGGTSQITVVMDQDFTAYETTYYFSVNEDGIISVDANGLVTGLSAGTVTVTLVLVHGGPTSHTVTVKVGNPGDCFHESLTLGALKLSSDGEHYIVYICDDCGLCFFNTECTGPSFDYGLMYYCMTEDSSRLRGMTEEEAQEYYEKAVGDMESEEYAAIMGFMMYALLYETPVYCYETGVGYYKASNGTSHHFVCYLCGVKEYVGSCDGAYGSGTCSKCGAGVVNDANQENISVSATPDTAELAVGETTNITVTVTIENTAFSDFDTTWHLYTEDTSIITIDGTTVTALSAGTATITVVLFHGGPTTATVTITVTEDGDSKGEGGEDSNILLRETYDLTNCDDAFKAAIGSSPEEYYLTEGGVVDFADTANRAVIDENGAFHTGGASTITKRTGPWLYFEIDLTNYVGYTFEITVSGYTANDEEQTLGIASSPMNSYDSNLATSEASASTDDVVTVTYTGTVDASNKLYYVVFSGDVYITNITVTVYAATD